MTRETLYYSINNDCMLIGDGEYIWDEHIGYLFTPFLVEYMHPTAIPAAWDNFLKDNNIVKIGEI
jgi:hypothetical protein